MDLRTFSPDARHANVMSRMKKEDIDCEEYVLMCLDAEKLVELCELYPETAQSLKYRSLDRRAYYLRNQQLQERELKDHGRRAAVHLSSIVSKVQIDFMFSNRSKRSRRSITETDRSLDSDVDDYENVDFYQEELDAE